MASKYFKLYKTVSSPMTHLRNMVSSAIGKKGKKSPTIKSVKPAVGSLTRRRKDTDEIFGIRKKSGLPPSRDAAKTVKKVSSINDNIDAINKRRKGKMGGGFMGKRMGYSEGKLAVTPREKRLAAQYGDKKRITRGDVITIAKKKSNVDKIKKTFGSKSLGMQSVIYGLDKNPNITKADPKAKSIAKNKKKIKKFDSPMAKAVKKKDKKKVIV